MQHKRLSFRFQLLLYLACTVLLGIVVTSLSNRTVSEVVWEYERSNDCMLHLGAFYSAVERMDQSARDYVYSAAERDLTAYQAELEAAHGHLAVCSRNVSDMMQWRITRLENMLDYYCAPLEEYMAGTRQQYATYTLLRYRCGLIADTSVKYYGYLTGYLQQQMERTQLMWCNQRRLIFCLLLLVVLLGVLLGAYCARSIYRPIRVLMENTERMKKGCYEFERTEASAEEIQALDDAFRDMAARIEQNFETLRQNAQLEHQLLQQENENLVMRNLVTEADLRNLQAQINPHFLFNTMSMITQSAYISGDALTSELMEKLSAFLRYALDKANKTSSLYEELESIRNYLFIQNKRFGSRVSFCVDVPPDIPNIRMPAIILQPLVENAIIHGVGSMTGDAMIRIKIRARAEMLIIHIEDNGSGMPPEQLEQVQLQMYAGLEQKQDGEGHMCIGLANVCKRLQAYYGPRLHFSIESEEGCGTIVAIEVPLEECT